MLWIPRATRIKVHFNIFMRIHFFRWPGTVKFICLSFSLTLVLTTLLTGVWSGGVGCDGPDGGAQGLHAHQPGHRHPVPQQETHTHTRHTSPHTWQWWHFHTRDSSLLFQSWLDLEHYRRITFSRSKLNPYFCRI